ncbi:MAG: GNAT family N-acetyltransferase [Bacilli bacterium]|nr:GNAT family N-acetyltransferase [Bacilli bacterium]
MNFINIKKDDKYLTEYIKLCSLEWGTKKTSEELDNYIKEKKKRILSENKVISVIGLIDNKNLIGFISLFKYDGDYRKDLTPWYATMFVKKEYRGKGYSKMLNNAILNEAHNLGYTKVYLKTELENYYEKFGAVFIENLPDKEKLYYIKLNN